MTVLASIFNDAQLEEDSSRLNEIASELFALRAFRDNAERRDSAGRIIRIGDIVVNLQDKKYRGVVADIISYGLSRNPWGAVYGDMVIKADPYGTSTRISNRYAEWRVISYEEMTPCERLLHVAHSAEMNENHVLDALCALLPLSEDDERPADVIDALFCLEQTINRKVANGVTLVSPTGEEFAVSVSGEAVSPGAASAEYVLIARKLLEGYTIRRVDA